MKPVKWESIPVGGLEVDFVLEPSRLGEIALERPLGFSPAGPIQTQGTLSKSGHNVLFRGRIRGNIRLTCARCLEFFIKPIDISIESEWRVFSAPLKSSEGETKCFWEDLETGLSQEGLLDLSDRVLEEVILSIPMRPLCLETCLGLCPVCGENRNLRPCRCRSEEKAGPFSLLKNLQVKNNG